MGSPVVEGLFGLQKSPCVVVRRPWSSGTDLEEGTFVQVPPQQEVDLCAHHTCWAVVHCMEGLERVMELGCLCKEGVLGVCPCPWGGAA